MVLPPKTCRLCAQQGNISIPIFQEEGRKINLQHKLRVCSPVTVRESDTLPKEVCLDCLSNLDQVYEFYQKSKKAQITLVAMDRLENSTKRSVSESSDNQEVKRNRVGSVVYTFSSEENLPKDVSCPNPHQEVDSLPPKPGEGSDSRSKKPNSVPLKKEPPSPLKSSANANADQCNIQKNKKIVTSDKTTVKKNKLPTKEATQAANDHPYSSKESEDKCRFCKTEIPADKLPQHEALHIGKKVYDCMQCQRAFMNKEAYDRHVARHTRSCHEKTADDCATSKTS
ncbi:Early growth response protein 1 [Frankliniella fusca]|uniref:Early growth response protein 1 n=1 Tax=Frankliniella fusca TaxID=407009 RepID=A0AAE1LNF5_9NEOP|nr:Early growth response protein 1 [Frankliniella fusca]